LKNKRKKKNFLFFKFFLDLCSDFCYNDIMKVTKKQIEILLLIAAKPLGEGLKIREAAKKLGISIDSVKDRLKRFKKNHPDAWKKFKEIRNVSRRERDNLHNHIWRVNNLGETVTWREYFNLEHQVEKKSYENIEEKYKIKRKF